MNILFWVKARGIFWMFKFENRFFTNNKVALHDRNLSSMEVY